MYFIDFTNKYTRITDKGLFLVGDTMIPPHSPSFFFSIVFHFSFLPFSFFWSKKLQNILKRMKNQFSNFFDFFATQLCRYTIKKISPIRCAMFWNVFLSSWVFLLRYLVLRNSRTKIRFRTLCIFCVWNKLWCINIVLFQKIITKTENRFFISSWTLRIKWDEKKRLFLRFGGVGVIVCVSLTLLN